MHNVNFNTLSSIWNVAQEGSLIKMTANADIFRRTLVKLPKDGSTEGWEVTDPDI